MARDNIKVEQLTIGEIFSERFSFQVPSYQRSYAWTTEHAAALLDDLLTALGQGNYSSPDEQSPYFLGSIVLIKDGAPEAQIVDGQQRLITLTILLAVLRSLIAPAYAQGVTRLIQAPPDPLNDKRNGHFRLQPKQGDAEFFQRYIQEEDGLRRLGIDLYLALSTGKENMRDNALHFQRHLGKMSEERRVRLAQYIVRRCLLVVVSAPDVDEAFRVFSTLNNRGLDLTTADLLKAEIIGSLPEPDRSEYAVRWDEIEDVLGSERFQALPGYILPLHRRWHSANSVLADFRKHVVERYDDARRLIDDVIVPNGKALQVVLMASYEHEARDDEEDLAARVNDLLRWLRQMDNTDWVPPAMLYLRQYHQEPRRVVEFLTKLERLAASLMIRRQFADKRRQRYARLISAIEDGVALERPGSPIQLDPKEREDTVGQLSGEFYLMAASPRNYVLRRLDSSLAGRVAVYDQPIMTVEHVLPRTVAPDSEWATWYPTSAMRARWVHKLGNLALLSRAKNHNASNYNFARKKAVYFNPRGGATPFALTTQILREETWTPDVVERRQGQLMDQLRHLWRL